jgi:hypothetical protein
MSPCYCYYHFSLDSAYEENHDAIWLFWPLYPIFYSGCDFLYTPGNLYWLVLIALCRQAFLLILIFLVRCYCLYLW